MNTMIMLECLNCSKQFERRLTEHKRCLREGYRVFCSISCGAIWRNIHGLINPSGNPQSLVADNNRDEHSQFRYFERRCKARKQHEYDLDLPYLKKLWERQNGRCPLTGWKICLPFSSNGFDNEYSPRNASLDRIDGSLGYVKGNVRYIALIANLARNSWGNGVVREFAHAVVKYEDRNTY